MLWNGNIFHITGPLWEANQPMDSPHLTPPVTGRFLSQRALTRNFDVFFYLHLNKQSRKQSKRRWLETPYRSLWRRCNGFLSRPISYGKCTTPWMFPPLDILLEYWIEPVTFGTLDLMFTFPTKIFYRGVPGFAIDCPCSVWCRGLTTCLLYVGPLFGNLV